MLTSTPGWTKKISYIENLYREFRIWISQEPSLNATQVPPSDSEKYFKWSKSKLIGKITSESRIPYYFKSLLSSVGYISLCF